MDFQEQQRLYKVRTTVLEMIEDRGITVLPTLHISFEEFKQLYEVRNLDIYIFDEEKNKKFYIHFFNDSKSFSKNNLKDLMKRLLDTYEDDTMQVILLLRDKENSMVTRELQKPIYGNVEIFYQPHMVINITKHDFQPIFHLMTKEEEDEFLQKYNITKAKAPKMLKTDPIAKYYGAKQDQVFQIIRRSGVSGEVNYYRVVK
jgi:DNA-directed RNA polymerase I, II, and III subunit RPABC1